MPSKIRRRDITPSLVAASLGAVSSLLTKVTAKSLFHLELSELSDAALANLFAAGFLSLEAPHGIAKAKGKRLAIYIARFGDDPASKSARHRVMRAIQDQFGLDAVEIFLLGTECCLEEGMSTDVAANRVAQRGYRLIKRKGGDLFIWGQVHRLNNKDYVELYFVSVAHDGSKSRCFGFKRKLTLGAGFKSRMGVVLADIVRTHAIPVVETPGQDLVQMLIPVADRLKQLANNPPKSIGKKNLLTFLHAYGRIQFGIGVQSGETDRLEKTAEIYRELLEKCLRAQMPDLWAALKNSLGNVLLTLGDQKSDPSITEKAVEAQMQALEERTPERDPLEYATTCNNLGVALARLGEFGGGPSYMREAIANLYEARKWRTIEQAPMQRATTLCNLAAVLKSLGEWENEPQYCEQSIELCMEALELMTGQCSPLRRASIYQNLGNSLLSIGILRNDVDAIEKSLPAYYAALKEITHMRASVRRALIYKSLALALTELGERKSEMKYLKLPKRACNHALKVLTEVRFPREYSGVMEILLRIDRVLEVC